MKMGTLVPLQNRVDPFGNIHAVTQRGMFTGNRGVIHDPDARALLGRRWTTKAWIICDCGFEGRRRDVMGRNAPGGGAGWTNLFFLDEVTALAAGHRPCFYCRREKAKEFVDCVARGLGIARPRAPFIDARLHAERLAPGGTASALERGRLAKLPGGSVVGDGDAAFAIRAGCALRWSFSGYDRAFSPRLLGRTLRLLTPATTVAALAAGYRPVWHPSADDLTG